MDVDDDPDSAPNVDSAPFSEGEKVLAFHSSLIYEAKVKIPKKRMIVSCVLCFRIFFFVDFALLMLFSILQGEKNWVPEQGLEVFRALPCKFLISLLLLHIFKCYSSMIIILLLTQCVCVYIYIDRNLLYVDCVCMYVLRRCLVRRKLISGK